MRLVRSLAVLAFVTFISGVPAYATEIANNPDPSTIYLLQCKFAQSTPPYDAMTQWDSAVKAADEFHKPEAVKRADANLKAKFASLEGVKTIVINLGSRFSEYDTQYKEYNFDLNDGSYISYNTFGRQVRIALTNGTAAQTWKLGPKDAEDVLRKNKGNRSTTLVLTLSLLGSPAAVDGEPVVLNAKIIGYDVLTEFGNVKLGNVIVDNAP